MRRMRRAGDTFVGVQLENVDLERGGRPVLHHIDWHIKPGQRWILAGGNGAGKTQLLKLVAGSVWPTPREPPASPAKRLYRWKNAIWRTPQEVKEEIGYLGPERQDKYERYGWNHTVEQIVGTGLYRTDIPLDRLSDTDRKRIASVLGRLGIGAFAPRSLLSLSYGERRLALLARTLASRSKLLLLDELLNGLDATNRARALRWLQHTTRSKLPWVLTTHRLEDVPDCVTHALVLEGGRVVYCGKASKAPLARWLPPDHVPPTPPPAMRRRAATSKQPLLRLTHATVYLDEHVALSDISFEVRNGQCWVIHGRNGSGKTTLLRTLYGDHGVAAGGRIEREGIEPGVPLQVFKTRVGLVAPHLQTDHPQHLTVAEVVQSGRHASIGLNEPPSAADRAAAKRALAFFGLSNFAPRTLVELSYGQMRRVLFARAWVRRPDLLLLDEPFSGVDGPTRRGLQAHIEAMIAAGSAVVMASHHRAEWPASTTHELELSGGRMVYCGPVRSAPRAAARSGSR